MELFRRLLYISLLGLPKALLVSLWTPKTWKNILFFKSPFRCFAALDGSPGAILACPGLIWDPKRTPKGTQKLSKNFSKIDSKKCPEKDPKMTSKWSPKSVIYIALASFWGILRVLLEMIFGILTKRAQDGAEVAQEGAKMAEDRVI